MQCTCAASSGGTKSKKKYCCITDLMDHLVSESEKVYMGTDMFDKFHIYHDGLRLWWTKSAQNHMRLRNFYHRQIMCVGQTNAGNRYHGKVVGDSPEFCRALDSHGFADLETSLAYHCSLSSNYDRKDPRRFLMGTPAQVWSSMTRCWQVEPTS